MDDEDRITDTGKRMARLPLDPRSARILLEAGRERCLREALILTAGLSIPDPRELPEGKEDQARAAQKPFQDRQSDFVGLLNLWEACEKAAKELNTKALMALLAKRETARAEDMMRAAVVAAQKYFDEMYK